MPLTLVDLFAGCGGLGLGLEEAGFETVFVNELHSDAMATYLANRPKSPIAEQQNQASDILELTQAAGQLDALATRLHSQYEDIGLVAGGPPCQGYSHIGHRRTFDLAKEDIPSNHLYREMAEVIRALQPRAFLFENVRGLLTAKWTPGGVAGEIWSDVKETFEAIEVKRGGVDLGYTVGHHLVSAREYGVPQNRPRILLVGVRSDISIPTAASSRAAGLLPDPFGTAPDPVDMWGDLVDDAWRPGGRTDAYPRDPHTVFQHSMRTTPDGRILAAGHPVTEHEYARHSAHVMAKFKHMQKYGRVPTGMETRKFAQRVIPDLWPSAGPNITATSLPDDYVHFEQPRVPTVREWARLQTFPDWYQFEGKRTTGGRRRAGDPSKGDWKRELPKYTQIGNAVPVALGRAVGEHLVKLINH